MLSALIKTPWLVGDHLVYPELPRDNFKDGDGIAREAALLLLEDVAVAEVVHQVAALLGVERLQVGGGVRPHIGHGEVEQQRHCTVLYEPDNLSICIFAPLIPYFRLKTPFLCFYP